MSPDQAPAEAAVPARLLHHRRRSLLLGAVLISSSFATDVLVGHPASVYLWRVGWIGFVLLAAWLHRASDPSRAMLGVHLGAIATGIAVVGIVQLTGGTASLYAGMLLVTPFAALAAMPDVPMAALLTGAWCVVGGAWMRGAEGQPWPMVLAWVLLSGVMVVLAGWATVATRHLWEAELAAEQATVRALAALGESERRRAESERLAEVGRLAARVAHEVNSPLAVVKSNVSWLGEVEPGSPEAAERPQVVSETLESVARIERAVADVRRSSGARPAPRDKA